MLWNCCGVLSSALAISVEDGVYTWTSGIAVRSPCRDGEFRSSVWTLRNVLGSSGAAIPPTSLYGSNSGANPSRERSARSILSASRPLEAREDLCRCEDGATGGQTRALGKCLEGEGK